MLDCSLALESHGRSGGHGLHFGRGSALLFIASDVLGVDVRYAFVRPLVGCYADVFPFITGGVVGNEVREDIYRRS